MSRYTQLSLEERCSIARLHEAGQSIRQIAAALDRQPSTIARELKRNTGRKVGYQPAYAQAQASARRWAGSRLERDDSLRETVLARLGAGWSPEQIAGRLAREEGHKVISHESIYRFVYAQLKRTNDTTWRLYLPRAKIKRGWRTKGGWPRTDEKCSIHDRPEHIAARQTPGHWEADCMLFSSPGPGILVAHERHSRITIAVPQTHLRADDVATSLVRILEPLPPDQRQSITFDNGTEFYRHQRIASLLNIQTYFCDPRAPWQKGGIENAIGRLRRALPRKTDLAALPQAHLNAIIANYNNTPRKCLGFRTPAETFNPLHFKCESTPASSAGRRGEVLGRSCQSVISKIMLAPCLD
jgi:transposase, IS30 family